MKRFSDPIIKKRNLILSVAVLLLIPSATGCVYMKVSYDLLSYLPQDAESMIGQKSLSDDFNLASIGMLVVENMPDRSVSKSRKETRMIDGIKDTLQRDGILDISIPKGILPKDIREMLYSDKGILMVVIFQEEASFQHMMNATKTTKGYAGHEYYLGDLSAITEGTEDLMNEETPLYVVTAIILCMIVLSTGLESFTVPLIFVPGIVSPIVYSFGTNVFLGRVSYIIKALALVLQLDVTMDYFTFLLHRYQKEKKKNSDHDEATSNAIQATFTSITSFSTTIVVGLLASYAMQLIPGRDIGIVMAEGVVLDILSTVIILPALLILFNKYTERWKHPILLRGLGKLPGFLIRHYRIILVIFAVIFILMIYTQAYINVCYDLSAAVPGGFPSVIGMNKPKDQLHMTTAYFLLADEKLENYGIRGIYDSVEELLEVYSVVSHEGLIGGGIPNGLEPTAVKNIPQNGGRKMILVNNTYRFATDEEDEQLNKADMILYKYDRHTVAAGEGSLTRDSITITDIDFKMVNVLFVAATFLIIATTFRSLVLSIILVAFIELAICISVGIPFFTGTTLPFIVSIVIGTIQPGATADHAVLTTTRCKEELSNGSTVIETARETAAKSAPNTIISGLSFFAARIGVSFISKMDLIKSLCILISRGAMISMFSVLLVLPAMLTISHRLTEKTIKGWPKASLK